MVKSAQHEHELEKSNDATDACKVCSKQIVGSSYKCSSCNWAMCKRCLKAEQPTPAPSSPSNSQALRDDAGTTSVKPANPLSLQEVLARTGLVYSEKASLTEIMCKPKILPLKSVTLEKLEQMERDAMKNMQSKGTA